jgi:uncharacterized protein
MLFRFGAASKFALRGTFLGLLGFLFLVSAEAVFGQQAEELPPKPAFYFTDEAGVVDGGTAQALNQQLAQFERDTSNQILVAIYEKLPEQAEIAQYSIDTYNAWQPGQKGKDNGAILFVFVKDHKMFICTGRGLEGSLPDATCKEIISQLITPAFRKGKYADGIQAGVNAMIAATKGEYRGTGQTDAEAQDQDNDTGGGFPVWVIFVIIILILVTRFFGGRMIGGPMIYTGGGFGGGGFSGGGFSGGGGGFGGFSGGGGSSAGGGAGGGW